METNTENWKDHLQKGGSLMIVILGNILYALAVKLFLMPAGLLTGGTLTLNFSILSYRFSAAPPGATVPPSLGAMGS